MTSMQRLGLLLILLLCALACRKNPALQELPQPDNKALLEWHRNEAIIEEALEVPSDPDKLLRAAIFFQNLTGIRVSGDATTFGYMPNSQTKSDLGRLRRWFKQNQSNLYWDEESKSVKLRAGS